MFLAMAKVTIFLERFMLMLYFIDPQTYTQKPRSYSEDYQNLSNKSKQGHGQKPQQTYMDPYYAGGGMNLPKIDSVMTNIESPQIDPTQQQQHQGRENS